MNSSEPEQLKAGDPHYTAYVGPPHQYDFMGATQFRLLCTLGLRGHHRLLDFGCGSLRAGRLLIPYLNPGNYFGIEPNDWLIREAIEKEVGQDQVRIKAPTFSNDASFDPNVLGVKFDYIVAQSIFSHTGTDLIAKGLRGIREALQDDGLAAVTFIEAGKDFDGTGWIYPGCVRYRRRSIVSFASDASLTAMRLPWFHPRQTWYLLARDPSRLPTPKERRFLRGAVLHDAELADSVSDEKPSREKPRREKPRRDR